MTYHSELQRLVRAIKKDIDEQVMPLVRSLAPEYEKQAGATLDAWPDAIQAAIDFLLAKWTSPLAREASRRVAAEFVRTQVRRDERRATVGIDAFSSSQTMRDYMQAATIQNALLIESIPKDYLHDVSQTVLTNMRAGMRPSYIEESIRQKYGVSARKAKFIARDQTAKVQGDINEKRQRAAGFEFFKWMDSHDSRVRHRHREIARRDVGYGVGVYRWDDLPLSDKGEPIKPGQDYQCRCVARAMTAAQVERSKNKV